MAINFIVEDSVSSHYSTRIEGECATSECGVGVAIKGMFIDPNVPISSFLRYGVEPDSLDKVMQGTFMTPYEHMKNICYGDYI